MGPRFLILAHCGRRPGQDMLLSLAKHGGLRLVADRPEGAIFLENGADPVPLGGAGDLAIGTLFERDGHIAVTAIDEAELGADDASLIERGFWGAYVAIRFRDGAMSVVRDPGGFLPCYYLIQDGLALIASDMALLRETGLVRFEIDWDIVALHLVHRVERPVRTALSNIVELPGGARLRVGPGHCQVGQIWLPRTFQLDERRIVTASDAVEQLRHTILTSVRAWSSLYDHILLAVSGGLDSSIVAAALAQADARFTCVTLATVDPAGDERAYARLVADHHGVELIERFEDHTLVDLGRSDAAHLPRPVARAFSQSGDRIQQEVARYAGADAFATGGGGDSVFCYVRSVAPLVDRLRLEGLGRGALETARDLSVLGETGLGTVAWRGLRRAYLGARPFKWPPTLAFRSRFALERGARVPEHPWRGGVDPRWPGQTMHLDYILGIQNFLEGFGRELVHPLIAPLMSQPILELCLRIPPWLWCKDGANRSIARAAFADLLPPRLLGRRTKGTPTSFLVELFEQKRDEIRGRLFEGKLAAAGLLDLPSLETSLAREGAASFEAQAHIMELIDIEAWIAAWS